MNKEYVEQKCNNDCIVCSKNNPASLQTRFFTVSDGEVEGRFTGRDIHASYKGRMHGGIIAAVLDETMARTLFTQDPDGLCVTATMTVNYNEPVPIGVPLKSKGKMVFQNEKKFEGYSELILPDGTVAADATGVYVLRNKEQVKPIK